MPITSRGFRTRFDPHDYGTVGAGNDTAAIQAAIDAAEAAATASGVRQDVYLAPRVWDIPGTTYLVVNSSRVHLVSDGSGATLYAPGLNSGDAAVKFLGTVTTGVTTVTTNIAKGSTTLTVASAAGLAVGDVIIFRSSEPFDADRANQTKGEFADIKTIVGTTVTVTMPIRDSYDDATYPVTVDKVTPLVDVGMHNITVKGGGVNGRFGVRALACDGLVFDRCTTIDNRYAGLMTELCRDVIFTQCHAEGSNQTGVGYGLWALSCERVLMDACTGHNNRHSVDANIGTNYPVCRNVTYRDVTAREDSSSGISTHAGVDQVEIRGCRAIGCGGGIVVRSRNTSIIECVVDGVHTNTESYVHGIYIGDSGASTVGIGTAGIGLVIRGCRVNVLGGPGTDRSALISFASLDGARIEGNWFGGHSTFGLRIRGLTTRNTILARNTIDCRDDTGATFLHAIVFQPFTAGDGNNQIGLTIADNRIIRASGQAIRIEGNSVSGANASSGIRLLRNDVSGFVTRGYDLSVGNFRDVELDLGAPATFTNLLVLGTAPTMLTVTATGAGTPEGVVVGGPGSTYRNISGGAGTSWYVKQTGTGNTGWVGK
jgi:hypothetical protein